MLFGLLDHHCFGIHIDPLYFRREDAEAIQLFLTKTTSLQEPKFLACEEASSIRIWDEGSIGCRLVSSERRGARIALDA